MADFVEVMILGGHPENRDGIDSLLRQILGDSNRRNGLIKGVARSAKEAGLLTGNDSHGSFLQSVQVRSGSRS